MSVTTAIILDKRRMNKKTKNYPVVIRVTFNRIPRAFPIGMEMSEGEFKKFSTKSAPHLGEKLRETKQKLEKEEQRAQSIIKKLYKFSFSAFRDAFYAYSSVIRKRTTKGPLRSAVPDSAGSSPANDEAVIKKVDEGHPKRSPRVNFKNQFGKRKYPRIRSEIDFQSLGEIATHYGAYIKKLEAQDRVGTVGFYINSLMSLLNYKPQLEFCDVNEMFLYKYEKWMRDKGRSVTTIGMHLRCMRRIFNIAIGKKMIERDLYPFGSEMYILPNSKNIKKAIGISDIQRIYEHESSDRTEMMCKDYWFFIYLGNGMNVKDMAQLKYKDMDEQFIRFIRAKTINTTRTNPQIISVYVSVDMQAIIERQGNHDKSQENYIFPILSPGLGAYDIREKVQLFTSLINTYMYGIGEALGITRKLSTMAARHSFSTQLKRSGASPEVIREMLGHNNLQTTMNYLDSFEDVSKAEHAKHLLPFKMKPQAE